MVWFGGGAGVYRTIACKPLICLLLLYVCLCVTPIVTPGGVVLSWGHPTDKMQTWAVSKRVSRSGEEETDLIRPDEGVEGG